MSFTDFEQEDDRKINISGEMSVPPKHWTIKRIKEVGDIRYGLSQPPQYLEQGLPLIRATNIERGKIVNKGLVFVSPDDVPYERNPVLKMNDIVVVRSGAYTADSALVPESYNGSIAGFDMVLKPIRIDAKYLAYVLLSNYVLQDQLILSSFRAAQPHLNKEELGTTLILYPPFLEQIAIADYLDIKTAQIDHQIDLLSQKATQYNKLKQSLINETITCGLDKTVPKKDSGIEWIGEVPGHWAVERLKNLAHIKTGGKDTVDNVEGGKYPFFVRSQIVERINSFSFDGEAILTAGDGVGVGKVFHYVNEKFDYHQRVYKISHFKKVIGKYLFYFMKEIFYKDALRLNVKSTVDSLRMPMFQNFSVVFGTLDEQKNIVDYLDEKTVKIDRIVATIHNKIEKLKELRKTLINDVVTGKIKVVEEGQTA